MSTDDLVHNGEEEEEEFDVIEDLNIVICHDGGARDRNTYNNLGVKEFFVESFNNSFSKDDEGPNLIKRLSINGGLNL